MASVFSYERLDKLGEGSFGVVYKAKVNSKIYAVKEIKHMHAISMDTFMREFKAFKRAGQHRNILRSHQFIMPTDDSPPAILMEYCEGATLSDHILDHPELDLVQILALLEQVANGVYFLHESNILHRDLKTENVLVKLSESGKVICKVADFGIAELFDTDFRMNTIYCSQVLGTFYFMAPEVWSHEYSPKSDVFSFGAIVLASLTRSVVARSANQETLAPSIQVGRTKQAIAKGYDFGYDVTSDVKRKIENFPEEIQNIVLRLISESKEERPSMQEVYVEIRALYLGFKYFQRAMENAQSNVLSLHSRGDNNVPGAVSSDRATSEPGAVSSRMTSSVGSSVSESGVSWGSDFDSESRGASSGFSETSQRSRLTSARRQQRRFSQN